jgi:hypothetical protein
VIKKAGYYHSQKKSNERSDKCAQTVKTYLSDGICVSVRRSDFIPYTWPTWCQQLEPALENCPIPSWAAMGFDSLVFAEFNACYSGRLKINASDQLVIGQSGQVGVFDGPHCDMSFALGMASTSRDCAYQGWYDKSKVSLTPTDFQKFTRDEWYTFSQAGENLFTAVQYATGRQTSFFDPNAPVNTYRLRGNGSQMAIELHQ